MILNKLKLLTLSLIVFLSILTIISTQISKSKHNQSAQATSINTRSEIENLNSLIRKSVSIGRTTAEGSTDVEKTALKRKSLLLKLAESDPNLFLELATLSGIRDSLPENVRPHIETGYNALSSVKVYQVDNFNNIEEKKDYIILNGGTQYKASFINNIPKPEFSLNANIKGLVLDNQLIIQSLDNVQTSANTTTNRTVAVIPIIFSNNKKIPITEEETNNILMGDRNSLRSFYRENTYNKVNFTGTYINPVEIIYTDDYCSQYYYTWIQEAQKKLQELNINIKGYDHQIYMFPEPASCPHDALGEMNGSQIFVFDSFNSYTLGVFTHEIGHNLGMSHSNSTNCYPEQIAAETSCETFQYGEYYDVMGNMWMMPFPHLPHMNGLQKLKAGWIPQSNIAVVSSSKVYRVYNIEEETSQTQILKFPSQSSDSTYYISYRKAIGYDASLPSLISSGASIHRLNTYDGSTNILDMSPSTRAQTNGTFGLISDGPLRNGQSFIDYINLIEVIQKSNTTNYVDIEVKVDGGKPCRLSNTAPTANSIIRDTATFTWSPCAKRKYQLNIYSSDRDEIQGPIDENTFTLPQLIPGVSYSWKVRACAASSTATCEDPSEWSTPTTFEYQGPNTAPSTCTPVLTSPITFPNIIARWQNCPGKSYQINIIGDGKNETHGPFKTNYFEIVNTRNAVTYSWKVRACDLSVLSKCSNPGPWSNTITHTPIYSTLTPTPTPNNEACTPKLKSPASNSYITTSYARLEWYSCDGKNYQVSIQGGGTNSTVGPIRNTYHEVYTPVVNTPYTWKVRTCMSTSLENCINPGQWSASSTFTYVSLTPQPTSTPTPNTSLCVPTLISPKSGSVGSPSTLLEWSTCTDRKYQVHITNADGSVSLTYGITTLKQFLLGNSFVKDVKYTWRVRSCDVISSGNNCINPGKWSKTRTFVYKNTTSP